MVGDTEPATLSLKEFFPGVIVRAIITKKDTNGGTNVRDAIGFFGKEVGFEHVASHDGMCRYEGLISHANSSY